MEQLQEEFNKDNKEGFRLESKPPLPGVLEKEGVTQKDWEKFEELSFEYFFDQGFLERNEKGELVADLEKISNFSYRDFSSKLKPQSEGGITFNKKQLIASNTASLFANLFHDREVLVKGIDSDPRPLVYIPENEESLADIEAMRNSWMALNEIGLTQSHSIRYPTKEEGMNSSLQLADVAPIYLVYAVGNGQRDEKGVLWVDKNVGKNSTRAKLTAEWFRLNGFRGPTGAKFGENTDKLFEGREKIWEDTGLLRRTDLPEASRFKKDRTISNGRVTIDNKTFTLGSEYKKGRLEPITTHEYLIYDEEGNLKAILDKNLDVAKYPETTVISREFNGKNYPQVLVNNPAVNVTPLDSLGSYSNIRTYGNEKVRETVDIRREISSLIDFRKGVSDDARSALEQFSLKDQINISRSIRKLGEIGDTRGLDFLEKTGKVGMQILAETEARGGLDQRLLDIKDLEESERERLLQDYSELLSSFDSLGDTMLSKAKEKGLDQSSILLVSRLKESLLSRSTDFLLAEMNNSDISGEMSRLSESLNSVSGVLNGDIKYKMELGGDKQSGATQARYKLENGSELNIVVRPEKSDNAQARISFVYRDSEGNRSDLRLDHDEYGLSLDISRRGTSLHSSLNELGKSHHTQANFEKGLGMNELEFKKLAQQMPKILGWN